MKLFSVSSKLLAVFVASTLLLTACGGSSKSSGEKLKEETTDKL